MTKKILIAHDFNLKLKMYSLDKKLLAKNQYINKKFYLKDCKVLLDNEKNNVKVFWGNRLSEKQINEFTNLKFVQFGSKGVNDNIKDILKRKRIKFSISKKIFVKPIVASIIGSIFSSSRGINLSYYLRSKNKNDRTEIDKYNNYINNVFDEKFLLVGYGEINKKLYSILRNFSNNISVINRSRIVNKNIKSIKNLKKLSTAVKNKKFIINTLPLTDDTKNIFNQNVFKKFSMNTVFINYGRGDTVNLRDLIKYHKSKKMIVCLDVFNKSQYTNSYKPFGKKFYFSKKFLNIITPHIGSYDNNYWEKQIKIFSQNLNKFVNIIY